MKIRFIVTAACLAGLSGLASAEYPNTARDIAANCANCHGTNGHSVGGSDSLAGVPADNILQKLQEFRDGDRPSTLMYQVVKGYTEEQLKLVAEYFAAQK